jgi:hypothetical protein
VKILFLKAATKSNNIPVHNVNEMKRRSSEWTTQITTYLFVTPRIATGGGLGGGGPTRLSDYSSEGKEMTDNWHYMESLAQWQYNEGLLDCTMFLRDLLELVVAMTDVNKKYDAKPYEGRTMQALSLNQMYSVLNMLVKYLPVLSSSGQYVSKLIYATVVNFNKMFKNGSPTVYQSMLQDKIFRILNCILQYIVVNVPEVIKLSQSEQWPRWVVCHALRMRDNRDGELGSNTRSLTFFASKELRRVVAFETRIKLFLDLSCCCESAIFLSLDRYAAPGYFRSSTVQTSSLISLCNELFHCASISGEDIGTNDSDVLGTGVTMKRKRDNLVRTFDIMFNLKLLKGTLGAIFDWAIKTERSYIFHRGHLVVSILMVLHDNLKANGAIPSFDLQDVVEDYLFDTLSSEHFDFLHATVVLLNELITAKMFSVDVFIKNHLSRGTFSDNSHVSCNHYKLVRYLQGDIDSDSSTNLRNSILLNSQFNRTNIIQESGIALYKLKLVTAKLWSISDVALEKFAMWKQSLRNEVLLLWEKKLSDDGKGGSIRHSSDEETTALSGDGSYAYYLTKEKMDTLCKLAQSLLPSDRSAFFKWLEQSLFRGGGTVENASSSAPSSATSTAILQPAEREFYLDSKSAADAVYFILASSEPHQRFLSFLVSLISKCSAAVLQQVVFPVVEMFESLLITSNTMAVVLKAITDRFVNPTENPNASEGFQKRTTYRVLAFLKRCFTFYQSYGDIAHLFGSPNISRYMSENLPDVKSLHTKETYLKMNSSVREAWGEASSHILNMSYGGGRLALDSVVEQYSYELARYSEREGGEVYQEAFFTFCALVESSHYRWGESSCLINMDKMINICTVLHGLIGNETLDSRPAARRVFFDFLRIQLFPQISSGSPLVQPHGKSKANTYSRQTMYISCVVLVTLLISRGIVPMDVFYWEVLHPSIRCINSIEEETVTREVLFFSLQIFVAIFGENNDICGATGHDESVGLDFNRVDTLLKISGAVLPGFDLFCLSSLRSQLHAKLPISVLMLLHKYMFNKHILSSKYRDLKRVITSTLVLISNSPSMRGLWRCDPSETAELLKRDKSRDTASDRHMFDLINMDEGRFVTEGAASSPSLLKLDDFMTSNGVIPSLLRRITPWTLGADIIRMQLTLKEYTLLRAEYSVPASSPPNNGDEMGNDTIDYDDVGSSVDATSTPVNTTPITPNNVVSANTSKDFVYILVNTLYDSFEGDAALSNRALNYAHLLTGIGGSYITEFILWIRCYLDIQAKKFMGDMTEQSIDKSYKLNAEVADLLINRTLHGSGDAIKSECASFNSKSSLVRPILNQLRRYEDVVSAHNLKHDESFLMSRIKILYTLSQSIMGEGTKKDLSSRENLSRVCELFHKNILYLVKILSRYSGDYESRASQPFHVDFTAKDLFDNSVQSISTADVILYILCVMMTNGISLITRFNPDHCAKLQLGWRAEFTNQNLPRGMVESLESVLSVASNDNQAYSLLAPRYMDDYSQASGNTQIDPWVVVEEVQDTVSSSKVLARAKVRRKGRLTYGAGANRSIDFPFPR